MGDRISISFKNGNSESVTLFSHSDGIGFLQEANEFVRDLKKENGNSLVMPLNRLEPNTVMVDFIRHITKNMKRVYRNYHLGKNETEGDNSDNGHFVIDLNKSE